MELQSILVLSAILSVNLVHGYDPTAEVKLTKMTVETLPNPYFANWSAEIISPGNIMSAKLPTKKDVPETMMISISIDFDGTLIPNIESSLCDALENELYGKRVVSKGIPKGKFPTKCPMKAGLDYEIIKYEFSHESFFPGLPSGPFIVDVKYHEPNQDPVIMIHVEGDLTHRILPGLPSFGR